VVLGTPTAAPPAWLTHARPEILVVGEDGVRRAPGSRRHACVGHPAFRPYAERITAFMADAWGDHPAVIGWQLDNELGCHGTARCHCEACVTAFQGWLQARHGSLEALNAAWGTVFWSQTYTAWEEVRPPARLVYTPNPGHRLDWCRFASGRQRDFLEAMAAVVRPRSPGRPLTHNLMGGFDDLDHADLVRGLDVVGYDNYQPPGWSWRDQARTLDRMRGLRDRPFWVLEQPCGPIDWGAHNPALRPGEARLKAWQAIAHGADAVWFFRWRAGGVGAEQLHGGVLPHDGRPGRTYREVQALVAEAAALPPLGHARARVALLVDEPTRWALAAQPHHEAIRAEGPDAWERPWYAALADLGVDVDVVPTGADLAGYAAVFAGARYLVDAALARRLAAFVAAGGRLVLGPRSGFLDPTGKVPPTGPPGALRSLAGVRVAEYDAPGPDRPNAAVFGEGLRAPVDRWLELLEPDPGTTVVARYGADYQADAAAVVRRGGVWYVGALGADGTLEARVAADALLGLGLPDPGLPEGVEVRSRGGVTFVLNHGPVPVVVPWGRGGRDLLGGAAGEVLALGGYGVMAIAPGA
jgi:beta-galactosidase